MLARRPIQRLIDQSSAFLASMQVVRFVEHLNRLNADAVEAEWELIILSALARMGSVEHEPDLGGASRLDVRFRSESLAFVADIRTVSDQNHHRNNPVRKLRDELLRHTEKLRSEGVNGGLDFRVEGIYGDPRHRVYKTKLLLPQPHEFPKFVFNADFKAFMAAVRKHPGEVRHHHVKTESVNVKITFNPGAPFRFASHPTYNSAHDLIHNVVHSALETKADQIKRAGARREGEVAGVFLCDGGCGMLRETGGWNVVTLDPVVRHFLKGSQTVSFVCVVDVQLSGDEYHFDARVWSAHPDIAFHFGERFTSALRSLPPPIEPATHTLEHLRWADGSLERLYSNYKRATWMKNDSLEISLRATLDFLAGRIDREQYERVVNPHWVEILRRRLEEGRQIRSVAIAPTPDRDDDGLVITFGDIDAAHAAFRSPLQQ